MTISIHLAFRRTALDRLPLKYSRIILQIAHDARIQHHKAAVDPADIRLILLAEGTDLSVRKDIEIAVTAFGVHAGHGQEPSLLFVKFIQILQVDIRNPVPVGEEEGLIIEIRRDPPYPSSGHRVEARVDHRYSPHLRVLVVHGHMILPVAEIKCDIRVVKEIIGKIFLDHMLHVAAADYEIIRTAGGVKLHDMPQDRFPADLHHRLRFQMTLLTDSGSVASRQNNCFHFLSSRRLFRRLRAWARWIFTPTRIAMMTSIAPPMIATVRTRVLSFAFAVPWFSTSPA